MSDLKYAAAYIRVSDHRQEEYSPASQLKQIREFAKKSGYIVPDEFVFTDEGITGRKVVGRDAFRQMIDRQELLEYAEYVGNFYGTPEAPLDEALEKGQDILLDIEVQGAAQVAAKRPEVVRIFIAPPSWSELENRLTQRGTDTPEKVQQRLQRAKEELQSAHGYDYFVINNSIERAVNELDAIMTAEHCRPQDCLKDIQSL